MKHLTTEILKQTLSHQTIKEKNIYIKKTFHSANMSINNTLLKRTYATIIMFIVLDLVLKEKYSIYLFVFLLKTLALSEVIGIQQENLRRRYRFKYLLWYFIFVSDMIFSRSYMKPFHDLVRSLDFQLPYSFLCFFLFVLGIVYFVVSLRKGFLKKQFLQLSITHFGILLINFPSHCILKNTGKGKFWFLYPVLLVAANDIFAYITGKIFGKTPLTKLSPNKTREGFIGGFVFTIITGIACAYLKLRFEQFSDAGDAVILAQPVTRFKIPLLYMHSISLILFASFIAPFGGMLASACKRLFKIKDFAAYLPGHGGITDRIDCQLLMGIFTRYYISAFIFKEKIPTEKVVDTINLNYDRNEKLKIALQVIQGILQ